MNISDFATMGGDRAARTVHYVSRQPSWVMKFAVLAFLIVVGLPLMLLIMTAIFVGVLVFSVLALCNAILLRLRRAMPHDDGRRNVRVIERR